MIRTVTINTIEIILLLLFIFYLYLVLRKMVMAYYNHRKRIWRKEIKYAVLQCIKEGNCTDNVFPDKPIVYEAIEELLISYMNVLKGKLSRKRLSVFAAHYFTSYYKKKLHHYRFSVRYNTLLMINKFSISTIQDELLTMLNRKNTTDVERFEIYRILASFQYGGLQQILCGSDRLPDILYRDIFQRLNDQMIQGYVNSFEKCSNPLQYNLVDILGVKGDFRSIPLLERLLHEEDEELRIRGLKAISKIGHIQNKEIILSFLSSEIWQERMMAAKVMGTIHSSLYLLPLTKLLSDPAWWVRATAAQGILRYRNGIKILRRIAQTGKDPFARDMAREWLERVV